MRPATRDMVATLGRRLLGRMDRGFDRLEVKVDRVAIEVMKVDRRIDRLEEGIATRLRRLETAVIERLEGFTSRMEALWRESAVLPRAVDEHGRRLQSLESRVVALETRAP